jgi:hypothetical protein
MSSPIDFWFSHLGFVNRVALVGAKEGWCPLFAKATYRRWFVDGHDPSDESEIIGRFGRNWPEPRWDPHPRNIR